MKQLRQIDLSALGLGRAKARQRRFGASLLGFSIDGSRIEGVALRRTNGSVEVKQSFNASLSLELLTNDPELVGREIRKHLDGAGIRERACAVCVPLNWALTFSVKLPELPPADLESFLQLEAERHFPYAPDALLLARSQFRAPGGETYATLVAVPRNHVARLEAALRAAQLRPVSFSLGVSALQPPAGEASDGVIAMVPGENNISLQISCGGGVAILRAVEGAFELEGSKRQFQADQVAREVRITLGQLPSDLRDSVRGSVNQLRIFGRSEDTQEMTEELGRRMASLGIQVTQVKTCPAEAFGVRIPSGTPVSPALSLAALILSERQPDFEFLPPRVSAWRQFAVKYSSQKLVYSGIAAGAVVLLMALGFLFQQIQLWRWGSQWEAMKSPVAELEAMQAQIKKYRPWFDDSYRLLSILTRLTEAFPEDSSVSAKTVEIQHPASITCSGTAQDNQSLLRMLDKLRNTKEVSGINVEQTKGNRPMHFTFNFQWSEGGGQ